MEIKSKVAVVTGAGSGIGQATAIELAAREVRGVGLVDRNDSALSDVLRRINTTAGRAIAKGYIGDVTDPSFRRSVFDDLQAVFGVVGICVPAAGITRDALSVRLDKETGRAILYSEESFRLVTEI